MLSDLSEVSPEPAGIPRLKNLSAVLWVIFGKPELSLPLFCPFDYAQQPAIFNSAGIHAV